MVFNSFHFAYFFAILLPLYWALPHRLQNYLLLAASYYFYSCWIVPGDCPSALPRFLTDSSLFQFCWERRFLSLLILSTAADYGCGLAIGEVLGELKEFIRISNRRAMGRSRGGTRRSRANASRSRCR